MRLPAIPSAETVVDAGANAFDLFVGGGVAERSEVPRSIVDEGPQRVVYRYHARGGGARREPVLLVPPLAAPATCFDLRRGCSVVEHLARQGRPTYLVDYGPISFSDRELGLEHWVDEVIPRALAAAAEDSGEEAVHVLGWCLGGIMALLAIAYDERLPVRSAALVASPFDFARVRLLTPVRRLSELTGGAVGTALYRALGGAPAPLVSVGFRLTAIDRLLTKPVAVATHLHDRDWLAHMQAVDDYMAHMLAYPGRTFGQLYHRFFRVNELAGGRLALAGDRTVELARVSVPVLSVAGAADVLAPPAAVHHVARLLPNSPEVATETAPGGHLGVLTGRSAKWTTWKHVDRFLRRHDAPARTARPAREAAIGPAAPGRAA